VAVREGSSSEQVIEDRARYVPRGVAASPLVVDRADGSFLWDVEGRRYLDFGGGIACLNLGHRPAAVVQAIHEQADRYLHQCFMVGAYEPYVEVCRKLDELWPGESETKTLLVNSGAEAVENAVKIARAATGRPVVIVFDRAFHGRTALTLSMTAKLTYKRQFGPLAEQVHRAPAPYPLRGVGTDDALRGLELLLAQDVDPATVACVVIETVQGEGGFIPMPTDFLQALAELCERHGILFVADEIQSGCGRTGPVWAIEHHGIEPDLITSGKTLGGGLPLAAVTGKAAVMDAVEPGGLGGTFGGNPLACVAALVVLDALADPAVRTRSEEVGRLLRGRLDALAERHPEIAEVRGLGPMLAVEFIEQSSERARAVTGAARERGLVLLSCGLYGNVIRLLPPLSASDAELEEGLEILGQALADAQAAGPD
jgi:4-aminobutyrate aminotransferase / (S)-3-amino-2-methylpropionate transaminase / 5-aminovalerate transaminase